MKPKRAAIMTVGILMLLSLGLASEAGSTPTATSKKTIPDVKVLFHRAVKLVDATYPGAIMLEAVGTPTDGTTATSADDIVKWVFKLKTPNSAPTESAVLTYGPPPEQFGPVIGIPAPVLGDRDMPKAPALTLKDAVKLLRDAGYDGPFFGVTLRNPLLAEETNPRYIFTLPLGLQVAVDTVTRDVVLIS